MESFSNALIWDDVLHVAYRGFAPDFLASALTDMCGRGLRLTRAAESARAVSRGLELSMDDFSISEGPHASLNAKAWDVKILRMWLVPCMHSMCDMCDFVEDAVCQ